VVDERLLQHMQCAIRLPSGVEAASPSNSGGRSSRAITDASVIDLLIVRVAR
jgi:hypothetical protein